MKTKQEIRQEIRNKKKQMKDFEIAQKSRTIFQQIKELPVYKDTEWIFSYVSYNQEVDTREWLKNTLGTGKRIAVPKVIEKDISFFEIECLQQLSKGYQGILEPTTTLCADGENALVLMPGLAFDSMYHRCGYGGGFYDRYLQKFSKMNMHTVALAYDFQIYDEIPFEAHDVLVDYIVTETRVLQRKNGGKHGY